MAIRSVKGKEWAMPAILRQMALNGLVAVILAVTVSAQEMTVEPVTKPASSAAEMSDGEVRRIERDNNKITVRHGELTNLDMPPMTMVFQVKEPTLLDTIKVGDKIRFRAGKIGSTFVITDIQQAH